MLTLESLNSDKFVSIFLAIGFAERALPVWEREYPKDVRPRKAIEAAKEWLKSPSAYASYAAVDAAYAAASYAAYAAYAAGYSAAATASYAAAAAATATASYAAAAANAAGYAARALRTDNKILIHEVILESLEWILEYKIENGQSFAEPELILSCLTEEQKQRFLFNLDAVA